MSFGAKTDGAIQDKPKPLGLDVRKTSTHEQGRPLPWFVGTTRISATFLTDIWDVQSSPVSRRVGKRSEVTGYTYTCSFAAIFCHGIVDAIRAIYINGDLAWEGPITRVGESSVEITVESRGLIRFYFGTEDQTTDPDLAASGTDHPAYRGQCYAVFVDWRLGENVTTVSNIEVLLDRNPILSWWPSSLPREIERDANPMLALGDLWASKRYGLGLPTSRLDTTTMVATATTLRSEGIGLSPMLNSSASFSAVLGRILESVDGFVTITDAGLFGVDLARGTIGTPVTVTTADIVDVPSCEQQDWNDTVNQVFVRFQNRNIAFNNDSVSYRDSGNFAVTGSTRATTVTREWATRQNVAWKMGCALGRKLARPQLSGTINVRLRVGVGLRPGDQFYLTYGPQNISALLCRVEEWTHPGPDASHITLKFVEDLGFLNVNPADVPDDEVVDPTVYAAQEAFDGRAFEVPWGIARTRDVEVAVQCVRGDTYSHGYRAHRELTPYVYSEVGVGTAFAQRGSLTTAFSSDVLLEDPLVVLDVTLSSPDVSIADVNREVSLLDRPLHIFVEDEIFIGWDPVLVSAGRWQFRVARARYDTRRATHSIGATVWITQEYLGEVFRAIAPVLPAAQSFKAQPFFFASVVDLVACPELPVTTVRRSYAPLAPANLTANGDGMNPTYGTGTDVVLAWYETSEDWEFSEPEAEPASRADETILELYNAADTYAGQIVVSGAIGPYTLTNANIVAIIGAQVNFSVRIYYSLAGVRSINYDLIRVTKV